MTTIDSARAEYQRLIAEQRDGWIDLPCGGSVLIERGQPTRISDKGNADIPVSRLLEEASQVVGGQVVMTGHFRIEPRSPEMTAPVAA